MTVNNDIRPGRHCVFKMHVDLAFVAKYRRKVFDGNAIERLRAIFGKVCTGFEAHQIEMDGEDDMCTAGGVVPAKAGRIGTGEQLKGVSSRLKRLLRNQISWTGLAGQLVIDKDHGVFF